MMGDSQFPAGAPVAGRLAAYIAAAVIGVGGLGYAVHEHNNAQNLAAQNQQITAQNQQMTARLSATHSELDALSAKVSALSTNIEKPAPAPSRPPASHRAAAHQHRSSAQEARFNKIQSQLDAQGKAIDEARNNLSSTRTELSGSIARTHDELVVLQKKGERSYFEFDLDKSKQFKREGPLSLCLRKANEKHQYADMQLMVDDRNLSQKHINLYQPVMYYQPDMQQPVEIVINTISKDHIHGYVSAPKYSKSELTVASADPASTGQPGDSNAQPPARQRLPVPSADPNQQ
ncbi:MAG TPA: hypothetical protein VK574_11720 [Terracidiphilus sp.]|nr:hypothetical protein [Terracidiphilus sp.]